MKSHRIGSIFFFLSWSNQLYRLKKCLWMCFHLRYYKFLYPLSRATADELLKKPSWRGEPFNLMNFFMNHLNFFYLPCHPKTMLYFPNFWPPKPLHVPSSLLKSNSNVWNLIWYSLRSSHNLVEQLPIMLLLILLCNIRINNPS